MIGKIVSHYEIIEKIGEGGMGIVYKAQDTKLERTVALKLLRPEAMGDPAAKERFIREARAASALNHPNITTIHEIDEWHGQDFICMEYVEGETVKSKIQSGQMSIDEVLSIAAQVAEALQEAHEHDITHRDIKSENIMVTFKGQVKVMDFGLAKLKGIGGLTKAGTTMGTISYMSPEQARGEDVDHRTDIWSFGVVLYEMITGQLPFKGEYEQAVIYSIMNEEPEPIKRLRTAVSWELEKIVYKLLAKCTVERYQEVDELIGDLKAICEHQTVASKRKYSKYKIPKRHFFYGGIAVLFLLVLMMLLFLRPNSIHSIDSIAVLPIRNYSEDHEKEYLSDGLTESLIAELGKFNTFNKVISFTSVMQYKNTKKTLTQIANELKVRAIIDASITPFNDKLLIKAQLYKINPEKQLWTNNYEKKSADWISLQREIALEIAKEITGAIPKVIQTVTKKEEMIDAEAYDFYLKGRYFWNKRREEYVLKAIEHYSKAIEIEPAYALAFAGLAESYIVIPHYGSHPPTDHYLKAKEAALKAIEIDNSLAAAHSSLAHVKVYFDWDWDGAEKEYKRAIELSPNYATAHHWYAIYLMFMARFEQAQQEIKKALELDPVSIVINRNVGHIFYYSKKYDEAIKALRLTLDLDRDFAWTHSILGRAYLQKNMFNEALIELDIEKKLEGSWEPFVDPSLAYIWIQKGMKHKAITLLDSLLEESSKKHVSATCVAGMYFVLGDKNQGFKWLDKAYQERDDRLVYLKVNQIFDCVRSDPQFVTFLKKMGFNK